MFDHVGRAPSRSPRRRLGALVLSLLVNGGGLSALAWLGGHAVEEAKEIEAAIERPIELILPKLGTPAASAPAAGTSAAPKKPRSRAASSEAPAAVVTPTPPVEPTVTPAPTLAPDDGGGLVDMGGDGPEGPPGGPPDGPPGPGGGLGPGSGTGGGVKVVHWSEAEVRVRADVRPSDYPAAADALKLPDTRCVVRIHIDERGTPYEVVAKSCPEIFRAAAESVAMRYRFYPVRDGGTAVRAGFDLTLHFRRD